MSSVINEEYLGYLASLLHQAALGVASKHADVTKNMMDFCSMPEAEFYLGLILLDSDQKAISFMKPPQSIQPQVIEMMRGMAGLILKNNIKAKGKAEPSLVQFLRDIGLLHGLGDASALIRGAVGSVIAVLFAVGHGSVDGWAEVLEDLCRVTLVTPADETLITSVVETIEKICEDAGESLMHDNYNLGILLPVLTEACILKSPFPQVKKKAILALNQLIPFCSLAIQQNLDVIIEALSAVGGDSALMPVVCQAINLLYGVLGDRMKAVVPALMQYTFYLMATGDKKIALEACEFWLSIVGDENEGLEGLLDQIWLKDSLLPTLMRNMRYSDDDPELLAAQQEDSSQQDRPEDIRPRHHRSLQKNIGTNGPENREVGSPLGSDDVSEEEDEEENTDEDYEWNLRKCSAATIDAMSHSLRPDFLLPALLPHLQAYLNASDDWKSLEVGILCMGAIAEGCGEDFEAHLADVMPILCRMMNHPKVLVVSISVWACSRFAPWLHEACQYQDNTIAMKAIDGTLAGMLNSSKKIQQASCSAMISYVTKAKPLVERRLTNVVETMGHALQTYQKKNLISLLELLRIFADSLLESKVDNNRAETASPLLPLLFAHWKGLRTDDPLLYPLLEAMTSLAYGCCATVFRPFAKDLLVDALGMAERECEVIGKNEEQDVEYDVIIVAMDFMGALLSSLDLTIMNDPQFSRAFADVGRLVVRTLTGINVTEVHQSALALLGDIAGHSFFPLAFPSSDSALALPLLHHSLAKFHNLKNDSNSVSTANNAIWTIGQLAVYQPSAVSAMLPSILTDIIQFLRDSLLIQINSRRGYFLNLVVTIGRLFGCCIQGGQELEQSLQTAMHLLPLTLWVDLMAFVEDTEERATALLPILKALSSYGLCGHKPSVIAHLLSIVEERDGTIICNAAQHLASQISLNDISS